jgi:hypothetical protein
MLQSLRVSLVRAAFGAGLALAGLPVVAQAAPLPPVSAAAAPAAAPSDLLSTVQWGRPYGHAYGYRRHAYRPVYRARPRYYRPYYGYRRPYCRTVFVRSYNPYYGGYVSRAVRRCG